MLTLDRNKVLGVGGFATVFEGAYDGVKVAVKRIPLEKAASIEQEEKALKMLHHPNVIKLFHVEEDQDFRYFKNQMVELAFLKLFENKYFIELSPLNCVMPLWKNYFSKKMTRKNTAAQCHQKQKCFSSWLKDSSTFIKGD
jgi:serine/threonine protein kinase